MNFSISSATSGLANRSHFCSYSSSVLTNKYIRKYGYNVQVTCGWLGDGGTIGPPNIQAGAVALRLTKNEKKKKTGQAELFRDYYLAWLGRSRDVDAMFSRVLRDS